MVDVIFGELLVVCSIDGHVHHAVGVALRERDLVGTGLHVDREAGYRDRDARDDDIPACRRLYLPHVSPSVIGLYYVSQNGGQKARSGLPRRQQPAALIRRYVLLVDRACNGGLCIRRIDNGDQRRRRPVDVVGGPEVDFGRLFGR